MKWTGLMITSVVGTMLCLAGCERNDTQSGVEEDERDNVVTGEDVEREASEAVQATGDFLEQEIERYKTEARDSLTRVETSIDRLEARLDSMTGEAQAEAEQSLANLRDMRDDFASRLDEASADTEQAWLDIRTGLERSWEDLRASTESAMSRFGGDRPPETDPMGAGEGG